MKTMKWKETFKHCILKGKNGKDIIGMQFVGLFIMQMMIKKLILGILKSWDVLFVTLIICMFLIQTQKKKMTFNIL